jgi:DNA repair protein RecN (Recombination protein N)
MLAALTIRDIVLMERLNIVFGQGLSVLTGETGAGKSILLDSLALSLGARGDSSLVRQGAESGEVVALFEPDPDHPVWALLEENGFPREDSLILRRVQSADGRTRAFINDRPVSAQLLREVGALMVEIHGQHDDRALIDPAVHRGLLDAFGDLEAEAGAVRADWACRREARRALEAHRADIAAAARERDYLTHSLDELTQLAPKPGEEERLAGRRQIMMQAEKVADDLKEALATLDGDGALVARLSSVLRRLGRQAERAPELVKPSAEALERSLNETAEALASLERAVASCAFDADELEKTEERLFALRAAARKHGCPVDELAALRDEFQVKLDGIEAGEAELARLRAALSETDRAYADSAARLSDERHAAARALEKAVGAELAPLKLERTQFMVHIETDAESGGEHGIDRVEFWVQTNPGAAPGPLRKIASGGELARFILALKVALADKGSAPTLIFDEIDTAVGGAVADAIGQRLARLAGGVQVIAVTHAPQVAARAASHLLITKEEPDAARKLLVTRIAILDAPRRQEEIARMLSGAEVTAEARAQAERLLTGAG